MKLKQIITAALAALLPAGASQAEDPVKTAVDIFFGKQAPVPAQVEQEPEKGDIGVSVSDTIASIYAARPGFIVGEGPVNQTKAKLSIGNITAFFWQNYDLSLNKVNEIDIGLMYGRVISDDFLGGELSGRIGYQRWEYPADNAGDDIIEGGLHYSGPIEFDITASQILHGSKSEEGTMIHATLAKPFKITDNIQLTTMIQGAYLDDLYGADGLTHITPGAELSVQMGMFKASAFIKYQVGQQEGIEDETYFGLGIEINF